MVDAADWAETIWLISAALIVAVYLVVTPRPPKIRKIIRVYSEALAPAMLTVLGIAVSVSPLSAPWNVILGGLSCLVGVFWLVGAVHRINRDEKTRKADLLRRGWALHRDMEKLAEGLEFRIFQHNEDILTITVRRDPSAYHQLLNDRFIELRGAQLRVESQLQRELSDQAILYVRELRDQYGLDADMVLTFFRAGRVRFEEMRVMRANFATLLHWLDQE